MDLSKLVESSQISLERTLPAVVGAVAILVLIAFIGALELERVSSSLQPLVDQFFAYVPKVVAWVVATVPRSVASSIRRIAPEPPKCK